MDHARPAGDAYVSCFFSGGSYFHTGLQCIYKVTGTVNNS